MKKEDSSKDALNKIRYLGGGIFLLGIVCLVAVGVLEKGAVSRDILIVLSVAAILCIFGAIGVVSIYLKPLLLDLVGQKYDRLNANPASSVSAPSSPEAMQRTFRNIGFVDEDDLLCRTIGRTVYAVSIHRTADFANEIDRISDRFDRFVASHGKKTGKRRILFAIYYMNRVAPSDFDAVKTAAVNQRTLESFLPIAFDTIVPILYDETIQAFRFMDGGTSRFRGYDVALRFFQQHILN